LANFDRGVYEPSSEARDGLRVFDGSEDEEDVEGSRLPLLIVLALLVLAMFAGVVWLAYTQGVARGRGETPVLTAANGPERVAPQDGGGTVPYQGFKIYEQPAPPDDSAETAPPAAASKPAPAPIVVAPPAPPPPVVKAEAPPVAKPASAKIEPVKPAPAKTETPPKSVAALIQQANSDPAKPAPAAKTPPPAAKPAAAPAVQATGAPRSLTPPQQTPAAATAPAKLAAPAPASGGSYMLQIGAFKSQAEAATAWKTYQAKHAALLSGYSDNVQQADLGEKGTWYRLRIGGLADKEVATALCDRLKADGGACMLGR
jgi:cell division septation protein DedD